MALIRNILWLISGGLICAGAWLICGLLCFLTVIGIPAGVLCIKLAILSADPFDKCISLNIFVLSFLEDRIWRALRMSASTFHLTAGILLTLTVTGIPFAREHFRIWYFALCPFSTRIR